MDYVQFFVECELNSIKDCEHTIRVWERMLELKRAVAGWDSNYRNIEIESKIAEAKMSILRSEKNINLLKSNSEYFYDETSTLCRSARFRKNNS